MSVHGEVHSYSVPLWIGLAATDLWAGLKESRQTADGLTVYLGVVPAAIVRGHAKAHVETKMHGGTPLANSHSIHLVAAVFNSANGIRRSDVRVIARIHGRGNKRWAVPPTSMRINGANSFGGYTSLGQNDDVMISIDVFPANRSPLSRPTTLQFQFNHD